MDAGANIHSGAEPTLSDRYAFGDVLGIGGTATVYRATHRESGREVAVKILTPGVVGANGLPGYRSVTALLAEVHHPGLVDIYESGVDAGQMYLIMRLVEGRSLSDRFVEGPLSCADVLAIGVRLADALAYVHDRGIVHRDIKPSNVLLDVHQSPYLTDFGISRLVDTTRVTATGMTVGTPAFMAPEQVRGERVGPPADIYSLGLVLLEAVTGQREYPGGVVESAVARLHRDPAVPPGLPTPLGELLTAMTAPDPAIRPSASAVAERLRPASGTTHEILPRRSFHTAADSPCPALPGSRNRADGWTVAAAAAVLFAAAAAGLVSLTGVPGTATTVTGQMPAAPQGQSLILAPLTTNPVPASSAAAPTSTSSTSRTTSPGTRAEQPAPAAVLSSNSSLADSPPEPVAARPHTNPSEPTPPRATQAITAPHLAEASRGRPETDSSGNVTKGKKGPKDAGKKG